MALLCVLTSVLSLLQPNANAQPLDTGIIRRGNTTPITCSGTVMAQNSIPYIGSGGCFSELAQGTGVLQESAGAPSFTQTPTSITSLTGIQVGSGNNPAGIVCTYAGYSDYTGAVSSSFTVSGTTTTGANTNEFYFSTFTLTANSLTTTGSYVEIFAVGTGALNADTLTIGIRGNGSTALFKSSVLTNSSIATSSWSVRMKLIRTTANNQIWSTLAISPNNTTATVQGAGTSTFTESSAITLAITCKNSSSSAGDCSFLAAEAWICGPPT